MPALRLTEAAAQLRSALSDFDPSSLSPSDLSEAVRVLAITEKACASAIARASARAVSLGEHRRHGFSTGHEWLAREMGSSLGDARLALDAAKAAEDSPMVGEALAAGELSLAQARHIAASPLPGATGELVELARRSGLSALRDKVRDQNLACQDPAALRERQRRKRRFRSWRDEDGLIAFSGALLPEVGIPLFNRIEAEAARLRRAARRDGQIEPFPAHAADALAQMLAGAPSAASPRAKAELVLVCDLRAYRRGHAHPGEPCHIKGGGPLPVEVAKEMGRDAFVKVVFHDGTDIHTVTHLGRHIPAPLRTALELGRPPEFDGVQCCEPECDRRYGLEWDHLLPVASRGPTRYENLVPRCWPHHQEKTERDRRAGLLGSSAARAAAIRPP